MLTSGFENAICKFYSQRIPRVQMKENHEGT